MKWIRKFVLISLMLLIGRISIGLERLPAELGLIEESESKREDVLLQAVMYVESNHNPGVVNYKENAVGILQIRPIMIKEVNRILTLQGDNRRFTLNDRTDSLKSIRIWYIVQGHHNPDYDPIIAARIWNGKKMPQRYWIKIKNELNRIESN